MEVIDPATIPAVAPLEIPGTLTLPLLGEVRTLYVAIAVAVLLVIVLFLLGFLIGRGHAGSANDYEDDEPQEPQPPVLEKHRTASVPRLVPRQEEPAEEPQLVRQPAAVTAAPAEEPAPAPKAERSATDEPSQSDEDEVRTMSLDDLLDDIHKM